MSSLILFQNTTKEDEEENQQTLTEEQVKAKIEEYNSKVTENGMKLVSTDFSATESRCKTQRQHYSGLFSLSIKSRYVQDNYSICTTFILVSLLVLKWGSYHALATWAS